jgi:hypothetical protein
MKIFTCSSVVFLRVVHEQGGVSGLSNNVAKPKLIL